MRFDDPTNPAAWFLASFLVLVVVANGSWLVLRTYAARPAFRRGPLAALAWLGISLFYLLVPFAALQRGVLSPYLVGLTEINWPATLSNGMILAALTVGGLLFGWLVYRRAMHEQAPGAERHDVTALAGSPLPPALARLLTVLRAPLDAGLQQWHWAFYRAALAGWLTLPLSLPGSAPTDRLLQGLQSQPLYWGAWLGILTIGLEWLVDPFARARLRRAGDREVALRRAALAVATTGLFVLTRNLWLCLVVHLAVEMLAVGWFPLFLPSRAEAN